MFLSNQRSKERSSKDNIVVEMKSDNTEEAILLGVNGEKQPPNDQVANPVQNWLRTDEIMFVC